MQQTQSTEPIFDFSTFPELNTDRLHLRVPHFDDAEALADLHNAPGVMDYLNHEPANTVERARGLIGWFQQMNDQRETIKWVMILKSTGEIIVTY
jgi:ribosomal-protein-alanine N-acetyltransferase